MLAQRISSINSLSAFCEKTGANINELSKAIGMDHRIGPHFLKASVGFGGSCFQKDILNLVYLCKYYGLNEVAEYWHQVVKINDYQKDRFAQKIIDHFGGDLTGKTIGILGWAFKANTNDSRESASIFIAEKLLKSGANIMIYDPMIDYNNVFKDLMLHFGETIKSKFSNIVFVNNIDEMKELDAIAITTEWEEFKDYDFSKMKVFDGRKITESNFYSIGSC